MLKILKKHKKGLIGISILLLIMLTLIISAIFATEQKFVYDKNVTAGLNDVAEAANVSQFSDLSDYKSKIYDSNKSIDEYIPSHLFDSECEMQFVGENYGFFIKTTKNYETYTSKVLLFEINRDNIQENNIYKYTVKPVLDNIYITNNAGRSILKNRSTYFAMTNLKYYSNLINNHDGYTTEKYEITEDNGYFIQGAYTEGKYMLLEEDNLAAGVATSAASLIFDQVLDAVPGVSLILGFMDMIGETMDWQTMKTVDNRPHIHYGDYNTQVANKFNRQVLLKDSSESRYIAAKENQEISFVIEYDNKNRNDVEAEIRNLLSFDIYEFTKEGYVNPGEVKLNSHNDYDNITLSKFNNIETTAIEDRYILQDNKVIFIDKYTQLYIEKQQTKQIIFTPKASGIYNIASNLPIRFFMSGIELDTNNLLLEKNKSYNLLFSNSDNIDKLCYLNIEIKQSLNLNQSSILNEGICLMPVSFDNINASIYTANIKKSNCSMLILNENMEVLNKSNLINNELFINYLFVPGKYFIVLNNAGDNVIENVELTFSIEESVTINNEISRYISNGTDYFVKIKPEFTSIYEIDYPMNVEIIETKENIYKSLSKYMLFNSDNTYYLKFKGDSSQISFNMKYSGKEIFHGKDTVANAFVNNIYEFKCNLTGDYEIIGIESYIILNKDTYSNIIATNNIVRLIQGESYFIIDKKINIAESYIKIEILHKNVNIGVKQANLSENYYKLSSNYNGTIDFYPNSYGLTLYDSKLKLVNNYNISNNEIYYIHANSNVSEFMVAPQLIILNENDDMSLGRSNLFSYYVRNNIEKRISFYNINGGETNYKFIIYDANYNTIFDSIYIDANYYNDIFYEFGSGQYYIGVYDVNNEIKLTVNDKILLTGINDIISISANVERTLYYSIDIAKTSIYNFNINNANISINGREIDGNGNVELTQGTYILEIKGVNSIPVMCSLHITVNAEERGLSSTNQIFNNNTIYALTDYSDGSYEFLAIGQYRIYDKNLKEIPFNEEIVFMTNNQYYIELIGGGVAYYKFIKMHSALTTQGITINLNTNQKYYYVFDNFNMNFMAISCDNPNVIITIYNDLGGSSESIIATGVGLVFAYSESNIRYVSFQADKIFDSVSIRIVDPKANVSNEIYWEQAMDIGQSYFKFSATAKGTYNVTCNGSCDNIEVFNDHNEKLNSYYFENGSTYIIKHSSSKNHTIKVELNVKSLNLNSKNNFSLENGSNYYEIDINSNYRIFSPTHDINVYQTKHLDAPIISVRRNVSGFVPAFSSSKRIIEIMNTDTNNCIIYVWRDLQDNGFMDYSINHQDKLTAGNSILIDCREIAVFTLPDLYYSMEEFHVNYSYTPIMIKGVEIIESDITLQVKINNIIVDAITKTIKFKTIGTPDDIELSIINKKKQYNGFESFTYSVVLKSGNYNVSNYNYAINQVGGDNELIIDQDNNIVRFNQDKDLYGNTFKVSANLDDVYSNEINVDIKVDQIIDFTGIYKESMPVDSQNNVELGINSSTLTLSIVLKEFKQHGMMGLVEWIFDIPSHIKYVEFIGDGSILQFSTIKLQGNSIVKIQRMRLRGLTSAIIANSDMTLLIGEEVIIWGNSLTSMDQEYPGINVNSTLNLILLNGGMLNVKGGMGAWGADGATGAQGAKGADGSAGKNGATGGQGGTGGNGKDGGRGGVGIKANSITLSMYGNNKLLIEGGVGGQGGRGGTGGKGGTGGADTSWWFCEPGAGGKGGNGGTGGKGGFGGYALECNNHNIPSKYLINHNNERSEGGSGGNGGQGGDGGSAGQSGEPGPKGSAGGYGANGESGKYQFDRYFNEIFGAIE